MREWSPTASWRLEVGLLGAVGSLLGVIGGTWLALWLTTSFTLMHSISARLDLGQQLAIGAFCFLIGGVVCLGGAMMPINRIKQLEPLLAIKET